MGDHPNTPFNMYMSTGANKVKKNPVTEHIAYIFPEHVFIKN